MSAKLKAGFTLMELIVVIAIVSILTIALISFLNPKELVDRGSDTAKRRLAADFVSALTSYISLKQYSANCPDSTCATNHYSSTAALSTLANVDTNLAVAQVSKGSGTFTSNSNASSLWVTWTGVGINSVATVCWQPKSKAMYSDASVNKYDQTGAACAAGGGDPSCYSCLFQ